MAPPPAIPEKPLACYPPQGSNTPQPQETCDTDSVLVKYDSAVSNYQKNCVTDQGDVADRNQALDLKCSSEELKKLKQCDDSWGSLPVTAKRVGTMEIGSPFRRLIPHLDKNGIDDFRSTEVMTKAAQDPDLAALMKKKKLINILYPASGSHMAPLGIAMKGIDQGYLDSAHLTYTEVDASAEDRVRTYLEAMASPSQNLITSLHEKTEQFKEGHETKFDFYYKGKYVSLTFALNRGGELWARNEVIRDADLIIFHDSVYNSAVDEKDKMADMFIGRLDQLTNTDGRRRFILTENQWDQKCETSGSCKINKRSYPSRSYDGFYGCGSVSMENPAYRVVDGQLVQDDSSPMKKHHVHPGPNPDVTRKAVLLKLGRGHIKPSYP